jgi:uncharacterized membrane protein YcaP (DUF421 family)
MQIEIEKTIIDKFNPEFNKTAVTFEHEFVRIGVIYDGVVIKANIENYKLLQLAKHNQLEAYVDELKEEFLQEYKKMNRKIGDTGYTHG